MSWFGMNKRKKKKQYDETDQYFFVSPQTEKKLFLTRYVEHDKKSRENTRQAINYNGSASCHNTTNSPVCRPSQALPAVPQETINWIRRCMDTLYP